MKLLRSYHGGLDSFFTYSTIAVKSTFTPVTSHHNGGKGRKCLRKRNFTKLDLTNGADFRCNIRRVMFTTGSIFRCSVPLRFI